MSDPLPEGLPQRSPRPGLHRFKVLARYVPRAEAGATWADLGGGAGEFARVVADQGFEVTLVDGDSRNIDGLAGSGLRGVLADLGEPLDALPDAGFDGASLIEVVEHVPTAERLTREVFRVLKPGGLLLLSTPNAVWWRARLRVLFGRPPEAEGYHYRFFTVSGIRKLVVSAGFEVVHMEFSSPAFGINLIGRRLLRRTKRMHVGIAAPFARLFAQTVYVVARKP